MRLGRAKDTEEIIASAEFDDYESARQHAEEEASRTRRRMAVVEDEGEFYIMTMRNADRYGRPHPDTVFVLYCAESQGELDHASAFDAAAEPRARCLLLSTSCRPRSRVKHAASDADSPLGPVRRFCVAQEAG